MVLISGFMARREVKKHTRETAHCGGLYTMWITPGTRIAEWTMRANPLVLVEKLVSSNGFSSRLVTT